MLFQYPYMEIFDVQNVPSIIHISVATLPSNIDGIEIVSKGVIDAATGLHGQEKTQEYVLKRAHHAFHFQSKPFLQIHKSSPTFFRGTNEIVSVDLVRHPPPLSLKETRYSMDDSVRLD